MDSNSISGSPVQNLTLGFRVITPRFEHPTAASALFSTLFVEASKFMSSSAARCCHGNISRGSVVDEGDLVACLEEGKLGGAGLDVFTSDPYVPEALFKMPQVVLQPHIGSATLQTRIAMGQLVVDNVDAYYAKKPLLTPVA